MLHDRVIIDFRSAKRFWALQAGSSRLHPAQTIFQAGRLRLGFFQADWVPYNCPQVAEKYCEDRCRDFLNHNNDEARKDNEDYRWTTVCSKSNQWGHKDGGKPQACNVYYNCECRLKAVRKGIAANVEL